MTSVNGDHSRTQVWDTFGEALQLFDRKNADYGDAWRSNGWRGNLSRIFEKAQRVRNLAWRNDPRTPAVGDEAVIETLIDMLNTTAFAIINLRDGVEWGHEVPNSIKALRYQEEQRRQHEDPALMGAAAASSTELFRPVLEPDAGAALVATTVTDHDNGPTAVPGGRKKPGPHRAAPTSQA
jgi:predicted nucleotide modification protein, DUF1599 family